MLSVTVPAHCFLSRRATTVAYSTGFPFSSTTVPFTTPAFAAIVASRATDTIVIRFIVVILVVSLLLCFRRS